MNLVCAVAGSALVILGIFPFVATENYLAGLALCTVGASLLGYAYRA